MYNVIDTKLDMGWMVIRLADGELEDIAPTWRRGYGHHWVRDIWVWTKGPFLYRNELLPAAAAAFAASMLGANRIRWHVDLT